ncbi:armadillo repeat-containing 3 isoform X1 [Pelobates cultripes]|uniref:Armadillo repeat-containing 3 isoform X1 n=1 Tax=Pelobates cultripes TaxID=61616 RepID=A0AAD1RWL8_PELCU|nr:armadillo repeat-containing 3 isoform X1 [Pelobates cultripes]
MVIRQCQQCAQADINMVIKQCQQCAQADINMVIRQCQQCAQADINMVIKQCHQCAQADINMVIRHCQQCAQAINMVIKQCQQCAQADINMVIKQCQQCAQADINMVIRQGRSYSQTFTGLTTARAQRALPPLHSNRTQHCGVRDRAECGRMGKKIKKEAEPPPKDVFDPLSIESKKAATAVLMLQSPEEEILIKSCEALYKFAQKGDENKVTLLGLGAMESIAKLISHEDKVVRRNATMVCGVMAANNDVRKLLRKLDIIPSLIARLAPEEEIVIHEFATLCLSYMANEYTSKDQIFELNCLESIIRLFSSNDPDVKKNAVECIYLLVQDFQNRSAVCDLNAIPPLLELLKSEYPIIQLLALKTLGTLSCEEEARIIMQEKQALDHLLKILEAKELNDLHVEALLVIANCLDDVETVQALQQSGGLKRILTFAETSPMPDIQKNAAKAMAKAARNDEIRRFFHEQEAETSLVKMLGNENDSVKAAALLAISVMCENMASKEILNRNGISQIVALLKRENDGVKEAAAFALANLTTAYPNNARAVAEADGVNALINLLSDKKEDPVTNACTVLINMATQEPLRSIIQTHGVMHALVEPLRSANNMVLSKATLTVAAFACDGDSRTEFRNAGGLEPLVKLLSSNHDEVRRNACWALAVCANDELTAVELCKLGALDILQDLNLSSSRGNHFSELAYDKLLDNNLSLKYSQKGCLSYNNLLTNGFYDHGRIKPEAKLLSLEELCKQPLNQNRAIIIVNSRCPELASSVSPTPDEEKRESSSDLSQSSRSLSASKEKGRATTSSPVEEKPVSAGRSPLLSRGGSKDKPPSRGRVKGKKEEEKPREEDEVKVPEPVVMKQEWSPPYDQKLSDYIMEASKTILPLASVKERVVALAQFVAEKMGGLIDKYRLHEFNWELHMSDLKIQTQSNVIQIGKIKKGTFYHRALLFKVIADRIGIGCCLIRGDYGRAWNEVRLLDAPHQEGTRMSSPTTYIVDLMFNPGSLLKDNSAEADRYKYI